MEISFEKLEIHNALFAFDGGTIILLCINGKNDKIQITLNRKLCDKENPEKYNRIFINEKLIVHKSKEESDLCSALRNAPVKVTTLPNQAGKISKNRIVLGEDIKEVFAALDDSPYAYIKKLVNEIINTIDG